MLKGVCLLIPGQITCSQGLYKSHRRPSRNTELRPRKFFCKTATSLCKNRNGQRQTIDSFSFLIEMGDFTFYRYRALAHFKSNSFRAAIEDATKALNYNLSTEEIVQMLSCRAHALQNLNDPRNAISDIDKLLNLDSHNSIRNKLYLNALDALEKKAIESFDAGNFQSAYDDFELLIDRTPDDITCYRYRAMTCLELQNYKQAKRDATKVINSPDFKSLNKT